MRPAPIKYMRIQEAIDLGVLQEINRLLLHPLGLALEVGMPDRSAFEARVKIWDYRSDDEGILFAGDLPDAEKAEQVAQLMFERRAARKRETGFVIQPVDTMTPVLTTTYVDPAERIRGAE